LANAQPCWFPSIPITHFTAAYQLPDVADHSELILEACHGTEPALQILGSCAQPSGLPYLLLASTAPLLQRWLGGVAGSSSEQPSIYRLFALSNLGSLCGLLSYPFAIEPFATLRTPGLGLELCVRAVRGLLNHLCVAPAAAARRRGRRDGS